LPSEDIRITAYEICRSGAPGGGTTFEACNNVWRRKGSEREFSTNDVHGRWTGFEILTPTQKIKLIKLREFGVVSHAKCRRKPLLSEEKNRL
jgi:hypothetical protein